ncbi:MAG: hypothetical protein VXZ92_09925, partial [SAR324 cluster bacterium]|nr:hypothetical protein [SAR324 cluster bacterium]
ENLSSTGTWYLDLRSMRFTEISEKNYEIYGIRKGKPTRKFWEVSSDMESTWEQVRWVYWLEESRRVGSVLIRCEKLKLNESRLHL